jgi:glycosyltransferase involved in cell wall biosynthesis
MMISVVSGTYNRLKYLQEMVESARRSLAGSPHEFVIIDGGSKDGTISWCKQQSDVVLIEHGKLLGAVKAFNDGAKAAKGQYVILANDDITFIDESILCAARFMQDHPDVGIGCFWQDRRGWNWHVEEMSAIKDGKTTSVLYGQVCIVPKWLGDEVGWWGDYLKTYGGDNELSCNVIEKGFKISACPCACIHDTTPMDELRKINNPPGKSSPDTEKWVKKWTRNGMLGPIIPDIIASDSVTKKEYRILYCPIYEPGHDIQKSTKKGLRLALEKVAWVVECDYMSNPDYVYDLSHAFKPNMVLMQLQDTDKFNSSRIMALRLENPGTLFVTWNGDYHPETLYSRSYMEMLEKFELNGLVTTEVAEKYNTAGINWFYWQIGWEDFNPRGVEKVPKHDVLFLGNGYSEARQNLIRTIRNVVGYNLGLYGSWPEEFHANGSNLYDFDSGGKLYMNCKIAISDGQWRHASGFVSNRLFQAMSAGAFLLQQHFDGMEELLGLQDGVHLVVWKDLDDLVDKIDFWLDHDTERKDVAERGRDFVRKNHSFDVRVRELFDALRE